MRLEIIIQHDPVPGEIDVWEIEDGMHWWVGADRLFVNTRYIPSEEWDRLQPEDFNLYTVSELADGGVRYERRNVRFFPISIKHVVKTGGMDNPALRKNEERMIEYFDHIMERSPDWSELSYKFNLDKYDNDAPF